MRFHYVAALSALPRPTVHGAELLEAAARVHRQWTEVCWSGVRAPSADDIVALSVPADALDRSTAPVKYKWAALAAGHLSTGRGCHE